jgi:hypothetical protein
MMTAEMTMITPIERSMPAVRMTSVCAAQDTDDGDLLENERQRVGRKEPPANRDAENDDRQHQHDQRHSGRCRVQEMLRTLHKWYGLMFKRRDILVAAVQHPFEVLSSGHRSSSAFAPNRARTPCPRPHRSLFAGSRDSSHGRSKPTGDQAPAGSKLYRGI